MFAYTLKAKFPSVEPSMLPGTVKAVPAAQLLVPSGSKLKKIPEPDLPHWFPTHFTPRATILSPTFQFWLPAGSSKGPYR